MMTVREGLAIGSVVGVVGLAAGSAQAQEIGFGGEIGIVSEYISSGVSLSSGRPALQFTGFAYVPQGFYVGAWVSTVRFTDFDPDDRDRAEVALFVGWERAFDSGFALDIGYEHYFYNDSGSCCGLFYVEASQFIGPQFQLAGLLQYDPRAKTLDSSATATFFPTGSIGLRATYGRSQEYSHHYLVIGADYFLTDALTASAEFHRATSDFTDDTVVVRLRFAF